MLELHAIEAFYGDSQALFGIDAQVSDGEVVTLLGRNGMGKTTTVRCLSGLLTPTSGEIRFKGELIERAAPHVIARILGTPVARHDGGQA